MNKATETARLPIEVLAEEYLAQFRSGSPSEVEVFAAEHPDLADEIRELFPLLAAMEGWKQRETAERGGRSTLGGVRPERLGDFRIVREVGRGGMGVVFEAVQESLRRTVAIKVLPPLSLASDATGQRFRREAQTAANLHHPHIVPVFGTGDDSGFHYIAMQWIDGRGLDTVLRETRLEPRLVARLGIQAAEALAYAHSENTLHRDIKPANLLLDTRGHLWVADFGLAKALEQESLSRSGDVVGTLAYMAPERLRGICDERADIYSLGLTLAESLRGGPVFRGDDRATLVDRIMQGVAPQRGCFGPRVPRDLETILLKAVAVDPRDRYRSASLLAKDLQAFLEDRPIAARAPSHFELAWKWCRRNPAVAAWAASTVGLLLLSIGLLVFGYRQQRHMRLRTEATLDTSLSALDAIYQRFQPQPLDTVSRWSSGPGETESPIPTQPVLSDQAAVMLEELLGVYDTLAGQGGDSPRLKRESLLAKLRTADIQQQLGRFGSAAASYRDAVDAINGLQLESPPEELTWRLRAVDAMNRWATAVASAGQIERSLEIRQQALTQLTQLQIAWPGEDRVTIALARTHLSLGRRPAEFLAGPPAFERTGPRRPPPHDLESRPPAAQPPSPPNQVAEDANRAPHLETAVRLLQPLCQGDRPNSDACHLLALTFREQATLAGSTIDQRRELQERSATILTNLVTQHPARTDFVFELCRLYATTSRLEPDAPYDQLDLSRQRLTQALEMAERLLESQPNIPNYIALVAAIQDHLAVTLMHFTDHERGPVRDEALAQASSLIRAAEAAQQSLVDRFPDIIGYRLWLVRYRIAKALVTERTQGGKPALRQLEALAQSLTTLRETYPSEPNISVLMSEVQDLTGDVRSGRGPPGSGPPGLRPPPGPPRGRPPDARPP